MYFLLRKLKSYDLYEKCVNQEDQGKKICFQKLEANHTHPEKKWLCLISTAERKMKHTLKQFYNTEATLEFLN